ADAGGYRKVLFQRNGDGPALFKRRTGREEVADTQDQVRIIKWYQVAVAPAGSERRFHSRRYGNSITEIGERHKGLELMVAIGPLANHMQRQVDLGGSEPSPLRQPVQHVSLFPDNIRRSLGP